MLPASSHLKAMVGVDAHSLLTPPTPSAPVPFVGIVVDPADYIPFIGSTVKVNIFERGCGFTAGRMGSYIHLPKTALPNVGHESVTFFASETVEADGNLLAPAGYNVMTCNDVGLPMSISVGKGSWKPKLSLFMPTSASIPISYGKPVTVGGPYIPDIKGWLMQLAFSAGFSYGFKGLGVLANKLLRKGNTAFTNAMADFLCKLGFEPVDLITGRVLYQYTDFELPGPIPFKWERIWHSDSHYSGPLGHGQHHAYDVQLIVDEAQDIMYAVLPDGRPALFSILTEGEEYNRSEKLTLRCTNGIYSLYDHRKEQCYNFQKIKSNLYKPTSLQNNSGHAIRFHYNENGHLNRIEDSAGRVILLELDRHNRIMHIQVQSKGITQTLVGYRYNEQGDLAAIKDALGQITAIEYEDHLMVKKTDRNGQAFYWQYDQQRRCTFTRGDGNILKGTLQYKPGHTIITNSLGHKTIYYFDEQNRCIQVTNAEGHSSYTHYTPFNEILRTIDEEGHITGYRYDERGNTTAITLPNAAQVYMAYDEHDRMIVYTNTDGVSTTYTYDEQGRPAARVPALGSPVTYSYNETGLLETIAQNENSVTLQYDQQYNPSIINLPDGRTAQQVYDHLGRCITRIQPGGGVFTYQYDALSRVTRTSTPDHNAITLDYNAYDEVIKAVDNKHQVNFKYTPLGSLASREEDGIKLFFKYDTEEQLTGITNEKGEQYSFKRNSTGDIIEETGFDGMHRDYLRSPAGRVTRIHRPGKAWTEYEYNNAGQISRAEYSDGSWEIYNYNQSGKITQAINETSTVNFVYNDLGQLIQEQQEGGHTVDYTYDENGRRTSVNSSLGAAIAFTHNQKSGQVEQINATQQQTEWQAQISYNSKGLEVERLMTGGVSNAWQYDDAGRPLEHKVQSRQRTTRHQRYNWGINDKLHNITNLLTDRTVWYKYDVFDNLVEAATQFESVEHYFRDSVGNIFTREDHKDRKYGAGGQLQQMNGWQYTYNEEGFLISKIKDNEAWRYYWKGNGMMKAVVRPDGKTVTFAYDALGRRTEKIFEGIITRFVWNGNTLLHEWKYNFVDKPKLVADEYGLLSYNKEEPLRDLVTWVFDKNSFKPTAKLINGECYSIITDHLGTPKEAYNSSGERVWECELTAYGKVKKCNDVEFVPFRFQGMYQDVETSLYHQRFRYYSPDEGMYVTAQDPIGLAGGIKAYSYALNPTIRLDVFGLFHHNDTGHNVYGLYDVIGQDAMGNDILADKPYYIGITNDPDLRATQHGNSGRLGDNSRMRVLDENVTYGQARGYEQAYIEHYGTKTGTVGEEISITNRGNKINSFDVDNTTRVRDRHQSFVDNRQSKLNELKSKGCH